VCKGEKVDREVVAQRTAAQKGVGWNQDSAVEQTIETLNRLT